MEISEQAFEAASRRGAALRKASSAAVAAHHDPLTGRVVLLLASGLQVAFLPSDAQGLENARPEDLAVIEISPSGLGLHFPALDADLYLPALLEGFLGSKRWLAQQRGRQGGQAVSPAKQDAARSNGRLGGRPRKAVPPVVG